jgi:hypothetical protein
MESNVFTVTENGFAMDGSGKVAIPACRIKATSFIEAAEKLNSFLDTGKLPDDIELITPMEKISFTQPLDHGSK